MSSSTKILVVDDEPIGRQLLEAILVPEGYNLTFGVNGEEAIKVALKELPDIILLDVMMPKMDGFEVCKKLRENELTAHIPIYLITALDDRDSRIRGIDAGAYDYISKPFDRVEILAKIKNLTTQINILKKNSPQNKETLKTAQDFGLNTELLRVLAKIMLDSNAESEQLHVYRSNALNESNHVCIRKHTGMGQYTLLISNKLEENNALLANCIFKSILFRNIDEYDGQLKKIIYQSYQDLNKIIEVNAIEILGNSGFTVIIVLQHHENNEVVVTGLNQHIYMLENDAISNQNQNPAYHSYYLQGNQELKFDEAKGILAFSPGVYDKINQKELLVVLNDWLKRSNHINSEQLAKEKLSSTTDLLIVKLTF